MHKDISAALSCADGHKPSLNAQETTPTPSCHPLVHPKSYIYDVHYVCDVYT